MMRHAAFFIILFCATALGVDISPHVKSGDIWKESMQKTMQGARIKRPDAEHVLTPQLTIGSITTGEVVIAHKDLTPISMQAMLYNKGDDGTIDEERYNSIISDTRTAIDELTGVKAKYSGSNKRNSAVKLKTWEWKWEAGVIRLEANSTGKKKKFQPEFIRLNLAADAKTLSSGSASDSVRRSELRDNIVTEDDGTVWLKGIPMVDQGQKGYCMPATLARIFAFYGMDKVDQHSLADLCDSSGSGGTTTKGMEEAMKNVCKSFRSKFIVLEDYVTTAKSVADLYNKQAKRDGKQLITPTSSVFESADAKVLRKVRAGKANQVNKWLKDIKKHVDTGTPVIWLVMVGIYQEEIPLPQQRGGHARLIIGYNLKKQTIIYTDSWGAAHARKTMPAANAISMTMGRYVIRLR